MERLRIKGFLETSFLDWPGKVAAVLFLPRCNFRCPFCHNHELCLQPDRFKDIPLGHILYRLEEFRGWVDGVCVTGGEPTLHRGLGRLLERLKAMGLGVKLDTNGSRPEVLKGLLEEGLLDHVAMDVKAPLDESSYSRAAGVPVDLEKIRRSIELLMEGGVDYTFRITVVPGLHSEEDILRLAAQLRGAKGLKLQNFNPQDPMDPSFKGIQPWTEERLKELQAQVDEAIKV